MQEEPRGASVLGGGHGQGCLMLLRVGRGEGSPCSGTVEGTEPPGAVRASTKPSAWHVVSALQVYLLSLPNSFLSSGTQQWAPSRG